MSFLGFDGSQRPKQSIRLHSIPVETAAATEPNAAHESNETNERPAASETAPTRPALRVVKGVTPTATERRLRTVVEAALNFDLPACIAALRLQPDETDPTIWWSQIARPALNELADRQVLSTAGGSPFNVADTAIQRAITDFMARHDEEQSRTGRPSTRHPIRLKKLVLIVVDRGSNAAPAAHTLAAALVAGHASARVVTGAIDGARLVELIKLTKPAALALTRAAALADPNILLEVNKHYPDLPVFLDLPKGADPLPAAQAPGAQQLDTLSGLAQQILATLPNPKTT
jgi:hypothetical protein